MRYLTTECRVACPYCGAVVDQSYRSRSGSVVESHRAREALAAQQKEETMVQRPRTNREIASAAEARLLESVRLTTDASLALQSLPFTMPQVTDALHDARRALDRATAMLAQVIARMPP